MIIKVNQIEKGKPPLEILITEAEADVINLGLKRGAEFVFIGHESINKRYIMGIFKGGNPPLGSDRQIAAPKPKKRDMVEIRKAVNNLKKELIEKGIISNENETRKQA